MTKRRAFMQQPVFWFLGNPGNSNGDNILVYNVNSFRFNALDWKIKVAKNGIKIDIFLAMEFFFIFNLDIIENSQNWDWKQPGSN